MYDRRTRNKQMKQQKQSIDKQQTNNRQNRKQDQIQEQNQSIDKQTKQEQKQVSY